jgi:hypothetical protein
LKLLGCLLKRVLISSLNTFFQNTMNDTWGRGRFTCEKSDVRLKTQTPSLKAIPPTKKSRLNPINLGFRRKCSWASCYVWISVGYAEVNVINSIAFLVLPRFLAWAANPVWQNFFTCPSHFGEKKKKNWRNFESKYFEASYSQNESAFSR